MKLVFEVFFSRGGVDGKTLKVMIYFADKSYLCILFFNLNGDRRYKMDGIINFYSENEFQLGEQEVYADWINKSVVSEGRSVGELSFIFCDDDYLLKLNQKFLNHDTLTDIISFDDSVGAILSGDIFISTERVKENSEQFSIPFDLELKRVMVHGVLHFCGYMDGSEEEAREMRRKEEEKMKMFHVEQ